MPVHTFHSTIVTAAHISVVDCDKSISVGGSRLSVCTTFMPIGAEIDQTKIGIEVGAGIYGHIFSSWAQKFLRNNRRCLFSVLQQLRYRAFTVGRVV